MEDWKTKFVLALQALRRVLREYRVNLGFVPDHWIQDSTESGEPCSVRNYENKFFRSIK